MVSKPDYDPNKIAENWETLSTDKDKAALVNRGTQGLYPPGSTFKIVTALAYIRQNPDSWQNYHYQCNGAYINGDNKINCYHGSVHGDVNLMTSFAKSCNASFANIGMSMDREKFGETIDGLLFNQEFSFPLPYNQTKVTLDQDIDRSGEDADHAGTVKPDYGGERKRRQTDAADRCGSGAECGWEDTGEK